MQGFVIAEPAQLKAQAERPGDDRLFRIVEQVGVVDGPDPRADVGQGLAGRAWDDLAGSRAAAGASANSCRLRTGVIGPLIHSSPACGESAGIPLASAAARPHSSATSSAPAIESRSRLVRSAIGPRTQSALRGARVTPGSAGSRPTHRDWKGEEGRS